MGCCNSSGKNNDKRNQRDGHRSSPGDKYSQPGTSRQAACRDSNPSSGFTSILSNKMGNSLKPQLDIAEKTGTCNMSKKSLEEFPEMLHNLTGNLRTLDLSENKLRFLPPIIGTFTLLKSLNLSANRLAQLPEEIGKLRKLETLQCQNNILTTVPKSMSQLSALRDLDLSYNKLTAVPVQLCGLKHLDSINLSHNKIANVPDSVKDMEMLELNLNSNEISRLSESIADCPRLKVLRVEENCLEISAFTPHIMKDSQIGLFAIDGNLFESKAFHHVDGYDEYMERYAATKKKQIH